MAAQDIEELRIDLGKPKAHPMRDTPPDQTQPPEFESKAQNQSQCPHQNGIFSGQARHQDGLGQGSRQGQLITLGAIWMKRAHGFSP